MLKIYFQDSNCQLCNYCFRMKYLVRKWRRATRVGSPVMTGQINHQHGNLPFHKICFCHISTVDLNKWFTGMSALLQNITVFVGCRLSLSGWVSACMLALSAHVCIMVFTQTPVLCLFFPHSCLEVSP